MRRTSVLSETQPSARRSTNDRTHYLGLFLAGWVLMVGLQATFGKSASVFMLVWDGFWLAIGSCFIGGALQVNLALLFLHLSPEGQITLALVNLPSWVGLLIGIFVLTLFVAFS